MCDLSYYIKIISSPSGCDSYNAKQFECDKYLDCDSCLEDKIKEHDNQIIAEVIDKIIEELELHSFELGTDTIPVRYVRLNKAIEIVKQKKYPLIH